MARLIEEIKKIARQRVLNLLILGESGIGKSECALELIDRGQKNQ